MDFIHRLFIKKSNARLVILALMLIGSLFTYNCNSKDIEAKASNNLTTEQVLNLDTEGNNHFSKKDYKSALKVYSKLLEIKEDKTFFFRRGICYTHLEKCQEAIKDFEIVNTLGLKNPKDQTDLFYYLSFCYNSTSNFAEAIVLLDMAIDSFPDYADFYYLRGVANMNISNMHFGCKDLNTAIEKGNKDAIELADLHCPQI